MSARKLKGMADQGDRSSSLRKTTSETIRSTGEIMSINKMTINIQMDNAAFDGDEKWWEVSQILRNLAKEIWEDNLPHTLVDSNGNSCGTVVYDEVKL